MHEDGRILNRHTGYSPIKNNLMLLSVQGDDSGEDIFGDDSD
jgi:hypothetical protein